MATFDSITSQKAKELLQEVGAGDFSQNARFYQGDHWQGGEGWTGPSEARTSSTYGQTMELIRQAFVSKNAVREVVDRHRAGVIGREPMWRLVPRRRMQDGEELTPEELALIQEAEAFLDSWWDARGGTEKLQEAVVNALLGGRGVLRLFVPAGRREGDVVPRGEGLEAARPYLFLSAHTPEEAAVYEDTATMDPLGVYAYQDDDGQEWVEVSHLDDDSQTLIRVFGQGTEEQGEPLDLGGHITFYELRRAELITEPVRSNQKLLNKARTMLSRNVDLGGFVERTILNGILPGTFQTGENGELVHVPDEDRPIGAGVTTTIQGVEYEDGTGQRRLANPRIVYKDPVPTQTFEDTEHSSYRAILQDTSQLHVLLAEDAGASGRSRVEARSDFMQSLLQTKPKVEQAGRWLLETVLAFAAHLTGQPGRFQGLRADFTCILDTGPRSSEEEVAARESYAAGLLSRETAMSRIGVEDTESEMKRIEAERMMAAPAPEPVLVQEDTPLPD